MKFKMITKKDRVIEVILIRFLNLSSNISKYMMKNKTRKLIARYQGFLV
jgi:hypothetical protein